MPLSEDEQRQLQQIEQAVYRVDPRFGRLMRAGDPRVHCARRLMRALPGVVIGAGMLVAGAVTRGVYLEAAGVMIVLLSLVRAVVTWRDTARAAQSRNQDGDGHEAPARADLAGPHDRANERAPALPPGG